jgi:hypothetical protein
MMDEVLLTIIATPAIEERLLDWLLGHDYQGFTTLPCEGHGVLQDHLSAAERVAGRQNRVAFWVQLPQRRAAELVPELRAAFGGAGLHYWISPLLEGGPITRDME